MDTKALRQKILDLAIRGKLVPQDPNDEPASVLLERIRAEKQQMVKEGKLKAKDIKNDTIIYVGEDNLHYEKFADGTVKCIEDEIPFDLPEGWEWCRFGNVVTLMSGTTYPAEKELLSGTRLYVKVGDMNLPGNEFEISTSSRYLDEYNISHLVPVNSVIFPKRGGAIATNKKKLVLRDEILIDLNTMAFTPISPVNLMYCYYWFLSIDLGKINSGSSVPQINNKDIEPLLFPVPPTFEQERIVQAIVPLLDAEQKISAAGIEVAQIISRAKSKILDLAIRGKLVPQDPNDEPASVLLERIRAEKEELIKQGKIKRDKKESIIFRGDDNSYYDVLPQNWSVTTLGSITDPLLLNDGDWILSENMSSDGDVLLVQLGSIGQMKYINKGFKHLTEQTFQDLGCTQIYPGFMLINRIVSDKLCACILPQIDGKLITTVDTCWVAPKEEWYNLKYLMYAIASPAYQQLVMSKSSGTTRKRISKANLINLALPFPPLKEQQRIVKAIEHAFILLDLVTESLS